MSKKHSRKKLIANKKKLLTFSVEEVKKNVAICGLLTITAIVMYFFSKSATYYLEWHFGLPVQLGLAILMTYPLMFKNNVGVFAAALSFGLINYIEMYNELGRFMFNYANINIFEAFVVMGVYAYCLRKIAYTNNNGGKAWVVNCTAYLFCFPLFYLVYAASAVLFYPVYNRSLAYILNGIEAFHFYEPLVFYSLNEFFCTSILAFLIITVLKRISKTNEAIN